MAPLERKQTMAKLTPTATVRAYCTHCLGMAQFNKEQVKDCFFGGILNGE